MLLVLLEALPGFKEFGRTLVRTHWGDIDTARGVADRSPEWYLKWCALLWLRFCQRNDDHFESDVFFAVFALVIKRKFSACSSCTLVSSWLILCHRGCVRKKQLLGWGVLRHKVSDKKMHFASIICHIHSDQWLYDYGAHWFTIIHRWR